MVPTIALPRLRRKHAVSERRDLWKTLSFFSRRLGQFSLKLAVELKLSETPSGI